MNDESDEIKRWTARRKAAAVMENQGLGLVNFSTTLPLDRVREEASC
jgi:hypothetical protein